tara:strand:- start:53 stop:247 length:195 start_codon:yes stop_codon:yes gene_type:complete
MDEIKKKSRRVAMYVWFGVIAMSIGNYFINPTFNQMWNSIVSAIFTGGLFALITYFLVKLFSKK